MEKHIFEKSILKAYDIRGVVDKNLFAEDAYFVGRAYGTLLKREKNKHSCVVGYDGRRTSRDYCDRVVSGLVDSGIDTTVIGLAPTPMVYFAVQFLKKDAGIIITASHNPPEYNGFKMLTNEDPIWGDDIQQLGRYTAAGDFAEGKGVVEEVDVKDDYLDFLSKLINPNPKKVLNVVWDTGNGVDGTIIDDVVAKLPGRHKTLFTNIDPDFPNHLADPSVAKNMQDLQREVVNGRFDLGIAFDGDGDRLGIVDEEGYVFYGDQLLLLFARDYLKTHTGAKVMSEVKGSKVLYDDIKNNGGVPVMWKPGHSSQKAKMKSDHIGLAGETSGHVYFGENHNYDDGLYAALKLIGILGNSEKSLASIRKDLPKTFTSAEIRIPVEPNEKKFEIPSEVAQRLTEAKRDFVSVDGVRADIADGWWLIRASNTEPCLTVRCEALSEEGLKQCQEDLKEQLKLSGIETNI